MRQQTLISYSAVVVLMGVWIGCRKHAVTEPSPTDGKAERIAPVVTAAGEFTAGEDAFFERKNNGNCSSTSCNASDYNSYPDCTLLIFQRWQSEFCAQTTAVFDFDTRGMPDASVVTEVKLRLYWRENPRTYVPTQPDPPGCVTLFDSPAPQSMALTSSWKEMNIMSAGDSLVPIKAVPFMCEGELRQIQTGQFFSHAIVPGFVDINCSNKISLTKFSRYAIDRELYGSGDSLTAHVFEAIEHQANNPPKLRVKYSVPYATCMDGQIQHNTTNCTSCSSSDFTTNTSGSTASVGRDTGQSDICGESQMVAAFDTNDLVEGHTITSATLDFFVNTATLEQDVSTRAVRIYSKKETGSCPASPSPSDFNRGGCASGFTLLGDVSIETKGAKTFTIPSADSNISKDGITKFVLIDVSTFSEPSGYFYCYIRTNEHSTSSSRPKLTVRYD